MLPMQWTEDTCSLRAVAIIVVESLCDSTVQHCATSAAKKHKYCTESTDSLADMDYGSVIKVTFSGVQLRFVGMENMNVKHSD